MLTKETILTYKHAQGDSYTVNVETNAGAQLIASSICGNKLQLPQITPAKYAPCPQNYMIGLAIRFLDNQGSATVTLKDSAGKLVDSFPVAKPAAIPGDTAVSLNFLR